MCRMYSLFNGYLQLLCCHLRGFLVLLSGYFPVFNNMHKTVFGHLDLIFLHEASMPRNQRFT